MPRPLLFDNVEETTTTTGTGTLTLLGAVAGHRSFSVVGNGISCPYRIGVSGAAEWENGYGTYTASGTTLSRDTVLASSNAGALVSFSAGTKVVVLTVPADLLQRYGLHYLYAKADYGAVGDGVANDTAAIEAMLDDADSTKKTIRFEPGVYLCDPNGILDTTKGVVIEGMGHISPGPGDQHVGYGAVIKTTATGAWCWKKQPIDMDAIEYRGGRMSNMGFLGDADTAGGLLVQTGHNIIDNCWGIRHTTGVGIKVLAPGPNPADAAALQRFRDCGSIDCLTGLQVCDADGGAVYSYVDNFVALKFSNGGILYTGVGIASYDTETTFSGGHCEGHAVGYLSAGIGKSAVVLGMHFENNTRHVETLRVSGTSATRNLIIVPTSDIHVGPDQNYDMFLGGDHLYADLDDDGANTMIFSNGLGMMKSKHNFAIPTTDPSDGVTIWNDGGVLKLASP